MDNGRIVRVRMDSEGREVEHAQRALDEGFKVLFHAIRQALDAGGLTNDENDPILSLETEFEDVYESGVREDGAIFYAGRRVVRFNLPEPSEFVGLLAEVESAEKLLDEIRDIEGTGISILPIVGQLDGARWRIIVSYDFGPGGSDLDIRRERLYDAAKQALEELRKVAPA